MRITKKETLAYLAGLIDGDGSVGIMNTKNGQGRSALTPYVMIANTHKPTLDWVKKRFGGNIHEVPVDRKMFKSTKPCYQWHLRWGKCVKLLREIEPYMKIKRGKAKEILEVERWNKS